MRAASRSIRRCLARWCAVVAFWALSSGAGLFALAFAGARCGDGNAAASPAEFDAARAWKDLERLVALGPRPMGSEALEKTRHFIEEELSAAGLKPVRETFPAHTPAGDFDLSNVYADHPGREGATDMVILATHFDTKMLPGTFVGANDGGSGTAVLLAIARAIAKGGPRPVTYRFLFLDGEEATRLEWRDPDNRYGSRHHAAELKKSGADKKTRALVLLDMVGDADLCFWRETWSDRRLVEIFFEAARKADLDEHVGCKSAAVEDDHQMFMNAGIPSIDLIDFDYGPADATYWHTSQDTLEHCSQPSLAICGRIVLGGLPALETVFRRN